MSHHTESAMGGATAGTGGRVRAAIIGLSWIGADPPQAASDPVLGTASPGTHASAMATIPEIEVVAGCDIFPAAREQFVERWGSVWPGVRVYEDYRELFGEGAGRPRLDRHARQPPRRRALRRPRRRA